MEKPESADHDLLADQYGPDRDQKDKEDGMRACPMVENVR